MYKKQQRIGIDVGGTFTDFVVLDDSEFTVFKVPTTPKDQSQAIIQGLKALSADPSASVMHGTTIATNALLEQCGARTALITTRGFGDVLEIGRQNRSQLYAFSQVSRPPIVPRSLRFEVDERINNKGDIQRPLDTTALLDLLETLKQKQVKSVAVVLFFSFLNETHERCIATFLDKEIPDLPYSLSVDLLPEYREYERTTTTVVNAYVRPLVMRYLDHLAQALDSRSLKVMQSSGGVLNVNQASSQAARLVLSGPAGGVVGAFALAKHALSTSTPHIMTLDMGGTSTDVALCPGSIPQTNESVIGHMPLRLPGTQIHTVGAGGGSLARIDTGKILRVGPQSAGAIPGPVCYGRGGQIATVTDANLVLGRLIPSQFLGGMSSQALHLEPAQEVIAKLGESLGLSVIQTALGILRVANAIMERALRRVSIECGYDPRSYVLIPYGGAGPLHACAIACSLGIQKILIPRHPGVLSACGLLMADLTSDVSRALLCSMSELISSPERIKTMIDSLKSIVLSRLGTTDAKLECSLDLRYEGQSYELAVPLELPVNARNIQIAKQAFHVVHHSRYGYSEPDLPVESVVVRLRARIPQSDELPAPPAPLNSSFNLSDALTSPVYFEADQPLDIPLLDRDLLEKGFHFEGPAIVVQYDSTSVIPAGWGVSVDQWYNLHLNKR